MHEMHVDVIDDLERLRQIRGDWETIYRLDPCAHFFLSWTWMSKWLGENKSSWLVLAAKETAGASGYAALFPLRLRTRCSKTGYLHNELAMGGNRFADYTGILCLPEAEHRAMLAFAQSIKKLHWTHFHLEGFRTSGTRLQNFLGCFGRDTFAVRMLTGVNPDGTNNHICPCVRLPGDWNAYLRTLSANTRQKLRRLLRKIETDEYRITHATESTIERDAEILIDLWRARWGKRKGDHAAVIEKNVRSFLRHCFDAGTLFLPVLWQRERALGALACLIDREKSALLFWIAGRDATAANPPPGLILHAYSIRHAIAGGLKAYDFLRGNEPYKYAFRPEEHLLQHIVISTRNGRNLGDRLEPRSLPVAVQLASALRRTSHFAEAERGYRQILRTDPNYLPALYGLAQLNGARADYIAAELLFRALVNSEPRYPKFWLGLASSLQAQERFDEAARALLRANLAKAKPGPSQQT